MHSPGLPKRMLLAAGRTGEMRFPGLSKRILLAPGPRTGGKRSVEENAFWNEAASKGGMGMRFPSIRKRILLAARRTLSEQGKKKEGGRGGRGGGGGECVSSSFQTYFACREEGRGSTRATRVNTQASNTRVFLELS